MKTQRAPENSRSYAGATREQWVRTQLLNRGYNVATPTVDQGVDLWVETAQRIVRVQVKTARPPSGHSSAVGRRAPYRVKGNGWYLHCGPGGAPYQPKRVRQGLEPLRTKPMRTLAYYRERADFFVVVRPDLAGAWIMDTAEAGEKASAPLRSQWWDAWDTLGAPGLAVPTTTVEMPQLDLLMAEGRVG